MSTYPPILSDATGCPTIVIGNVSIPNLYLVISFDVDEKNQLNDMLMSTSSDDIRTIKEMKQYYQDSPSDTRVYKSTLLHPHEYSDSKLDLANILLKYFDIQLANDGDLTIEPISVHPK